LSKNLRPKDFTTGFVKEAIKLIECDGIYIYSIKYNRKTSFYELFTSVFFVMEQRKKKLKCKVIFASFLCWFSYCFLPV